MSSAGYTIHVSGISPTTSEDKLSSFFSFCGTISRLSKPTPSTAEIAFAKESAAKTALMLNGGTLDGAHLEVQSASPAAAAAPGVVGTLPAGAKDSTPIGATDGHVGQEDKPAAGIIAEYLAHGYVLSDAIVQRAIELDRQRGISSRFLTYINKLDAQVGAKLAETTGHSPVVPVSASHGDAPALDSKGELIGAPTPSVATAGTSTLPVTGAATEGVKAHHFVAAPVVQAGQQVKALDQKHGISSRFNDYYSKAINTEAGQHILRFYTTTSKQVQDVHQEAKRIAEQKKATGQSPFATTTTSATSSAEPTVAAPLSEKPATALP